MDVKVTVESVLNPTEDEAKVERSLHNVFPSSMIKKVPSQGNNSVLRTHGNGLDFLSTLRNLIRRERIRNAARSILIKNTQGKWIRVCLNKQAAFSGRLSFCEPLGESPNGPISVEIEASDPQVVIDFLARTQAVNQNFGGRQRQ